MYNRPRHRAIKEVLNSFNGELLLEAKCYFAGGTAISLALDEFRESVDIDFLCASKEGYRLIRGELFENLGPLLNTPVKHLRDVRMERDRIYTIVEANSFPIKIEIVREARIDIDGHFDKVLNVPVLSKDDLFAQKLLANNDRGLDRAFLSRDIIDLAVMIDKWGPIPEVAWNKAFNAYGDHISYYFEKSIEMVQNKKYLNMCLKNMSIDASWNEKIPIILSHSLQALQELKDGMICPTPPDCKMSKVR